MNVILMSVSVLIIMCVCEMHKYCTCVYIMYRDMYYVYMIVCVCVIQYTLSETDAKMCVYVFASMDIENEEMIFYLLFGIQCLFF